MGACSFIVSGEGVSPQNAFQMLCEEAAYEYGHSPYSGTINTCSLCGTTVLGKKYTKTVEKKGYALANKDVEDVRKYTARCLDLGVVYHNVYSLKRVSYDKMTARWKQKYVVIDTEDFSEHILYSADTKKACEEYVRKRIFDDLRKHTVPADLVIAKRPVQEPKPKTPNKDYLARYSLTCKRANTKPKKNPADAFVEEVHKYIFYGMAAE